jgi:hypothetical protein
MQQSIVFILFIFLLCATNISCDDRTFPIILNLKNFNNILEEDTCIDLITYIHRNNYVCVLLNQELYITESYTPTHIFSDKTYKLITNFYEKYYTKINTLKYIFSSWLKDFKRFIKSSKSDIIPIVENIILDIFEPIDNFFDNNMYTEITYGNITFHFIPKNMIINNCDCISYYEGIKNLTCLSLNKNLLFNETN